MMTKHLHFLAILMLPLLVNAQWGGGEANPDLKTNAESLQNWQDLKFGLFVHWGPVSLRGTEIGWSRGREVPIADYDHLYREFNPVLFAAEKWVSMIKAAGMKYIVITSKHHDGFCIWDSEFTDYDIMSTPFERDILKELSDECRRQGILFGTYHSIADWHHPHYTTRYGGDPRPVEESDMTLYVDYLKSQVRELIEKYDTKILWFDGEWEDSWTHEYGMDLYKYVRGIKDDVLINNRVDKGRQGMMGMTRSERYAGDFSTPEQEVGAFHPDIPWESCITICTQWAWKPNDELKSLGECIRTLARTAGGGGNLLLNVGPMLDGRIEQRQIDRLEAMGDWLEKNGESIYGTRGGPFKPTDWMVSTNRDSTVYIHLFTLPERELVLPVLKHARILSARLLAGRELAFEQTGDRLVIRLPEEPVDNIDTVIVLDLDGEAANLEPVEVIMK
jgi:alpha-L-fucosidase